MRNNRHMENEAMRQGATITVGFPDGRIATGTFREARTFAADTDQIGFFDSRLHAYVLHLLIEAEKQE